MPLARKDGRLAAQPAQLTAPPTKLQAEHLINGAPEGDHEVELLSERGAHDATADRLAEEDERELAAGGEQEAAVAGEEQWGREGGMALAGSLPRMQPAGPCHNPTQAAAPPSSASLPLHSRARRLHHRQAKGLADGGHDGHLARNQKRHGAQDRAQLGEEERHADLHADCWREGGRGGIEQRRARSEGSVGMHDAACSLPIQGTRPEAWQHISFALCRSPVMKKRPMSRPLYGPMSLSTCARRSELCEPMRHAAARPAGPSLPPMEPASLAVKPAQHNPKPRLQVVLGLCQQQARQKGAEREGEAGDLRDQAGTQHHQQRERVEDGRVVGLCRWVETSGSGRSA